MKMNMDALKALELKLAEYGKENGSIAEHESSHNNGICDGTCAGVCTGGCYGGCAGTSTNAGTPNYSGSRR